MPASASRSSGCVQRDRAQGGVVEDHVGGDVLLARGFGAPGAQAIRSAPAPRQEVRPRACRVRRASRSRRRGASPADRRAATSVRSPRSTAPLAAVSRSAPWPSTSASSRPGRDQLPEHAAPLLARRRSAADAVGAQRCRGRTAAPSRCPRRAARRSGAPAPKRWPVRYTHDSAFCAATVPSQLCGGDRQLSQLPQAPGCASPKYASSVCRRQPVDSQ